MNNNSHLRNWFPFIGAVLLVVGMWIGYLLADGDKLTPAQKKLNEILGIIQDEYVEEIDEDSLVEMTIPEMMRNLDPHSLYIAVDDLEKVNRDLESSFFGIGIQFQLMQDSICVVEVISGGPAEHVGMLAGDRIIEVDGKNVTGKNITNDDVMKNLRGEKDSEVVVKVKRSTSAKPLTFNIIRGEIPAVSVDASYLINDTTGYLRINKFAANTYAEFIQSINALRVKGAKNYILDLRGNSGGLLDQAILMANEFLPPMHSIVNVKGRKAQEDANWLSDGNGIFPTAPLIILVDEFTASSSEIVAGAVQDNDRGLIIGRRTFGKGLVQRGITLSDSSQMRLTVQRYYTPSGRCIQKDYTPGNNDDYQSEILDRYSNGEVFNADSIKVDQTNIYSTRGGRTVYGGGGIIPDVFVPSDTAFVTNYYLAVANSGLLIKFAYEYADLNRAQLQKAKDVKQLLKLLPPNGVLLGSLVDYAAQNGVAKRWYYINISAPLIVNQLKALIARDILGINAYFEIVNTKDPVVQEALKQFSIGIDNVLFTQKKIN